MNTSQLVQKRKFQFMDHPWIYQLVSVLVFILLFMLVIVFVNLTGIPSREPYRSLVVAGLPQALSLFILAPFVYQVPAGKRSYKEYLRDIRLTQLKPFLPLFILGLSCAVFWLFTSGLCTILYRYFQGLPVTWGFIKSVYNLRISLPPFSQSYLYALLSILEEIGTRGILLPLFLRQYRPQKAIAFSAIMFGLGHLLNLLNPEPKIWALGMTLWAIPYGIFYGYLFIKSNSLLPCIMVHYLANMFIGSVGAYRAHSASIEFQVVMIILHSLATMPLLILWVRFYSTKWLNKHESYQPILHADQTSDGGASVDHYGEHQQQDCGTTGHQRLHRQRTCQQHPE
jgi:membrane protease YdiL (CAAX protease family)